MVVQIISNHVREVRQVASGEITRRDPLIAESWRRCVDDYGLDPVELKEAYIVPDRQLREHRERLEALIRTARYGLEVLYKQVAGQDYVLLLTDAQGVTVDYIGNHRVEAELRQAGLYLGAEWSEARAGTCGVGSCIHTGEALTVHQTDHFDATHSPLTCTAAPIYDVDGRLAAVLDISALHSPEAKDSQAMALHLVTSLSRRIEMANLMGAFRRDWIVRLSRSPEFLDVDPEYALAVDANGCIAGMTSAAQRYLARTAGIDWRNTGRIIGEPVGSFFDVDADHLPSLTRASPARDRSIRTRSGDILFAHSIAPQRASRSSRCQEDLPRPFEGLHGGDPAMAGVARKAARLADASLSILLLGETGTGKEFLARMIHEARHSPGKFIAINCAALPETLIESELFGYEPGAFTGARSKGKKGLVEEAEKGTLFLDEIGDMPLALQARLLRVLAEKEVHRIGASRPVPVNIRVLAASHLDLAQLVKAGKFREDLYYRLTGAILELPPLRKRDDLAWLIDRLLNADGAAHVRPVAVTARAIDVLRAHDWPGNIRQLANALEFAKAFCQDGLIDLAHLPENLLQATSAPGTGQLQVAAVPAPSRRPALSQSALVAALTDHAWNVSAAARSLGVDRTTVHRWMRMAGVVSPNRR